MSRPSKKQLYLKEVKAEYLVKLREELREVRRKSLEATRRGDFMQVARMTARAAEINNEIANLEGVILADGILPGPNRSP